MVLRQATTETASGKASRKPKSKQYEAEPTTSQHLSRYAVQQLLAQGVSQQTLDQIQAGKATAAAHQQSAADKQPTDAGHFRQPKCSAKSKKHQQLLSSGAAGLRARQDRIFSRISSLEQQAADSSPASLRWQEPNIELQVSCCWTGCLAAALRCAVLCCAALRCAVLRCAVLCCAALCCAALRCAVLRCAALRCAVLRCAVLCCAVLCCAVLRLLGCMQLFYVASRLPPPQIELCAGTEWKHTTEVGTHDNCRRRQAHHLWRVS